MQSGRKVVMLATNAFGLGIDKPDIRYIIHYQMPGSPEAYVQEAGARAATASRRAACCCSSPTTSRSRSTSSRRRTRPRRRRAWSPRASTPGATRARKFRCAIWRCRWRCPSGACASSCRCSRRWASPRRSRRRAGRASSRARRASRSTRRRRCSRPAGSPTGGGWMSLLKYMNTQSCRVQMLRSYFGEPEGEKCGLCDSCAGLDSEVFDPGDCRRAPRAARGDRLPRAAATAAARTRRRLRHARHARGAIRRTGGAGDAAGAGVRDGDPERSAASRSPLSRFRPRPTARAASTRPCGPAAKRRCRSPAKPWSNSRTAGWRRWRVKQRQPKRYRPKRSQQRRRPSMALRRTPALYQSPRRPLYRPSTIPWRVGRRCATPTFVPTSTGSRPDQSPFRSCSRLRARSPVAPAAIRASRVRRPAGRDTPVTTVVAVAMVAVVAVVAAAVAAGRGRGGGGRRRRGRNRPGRDNQQRHSRDRDRDRGPRLPGFYNPGGD